MCAHDTRVEKRHRFMLRSKKDPQQQQNRKKRKRKKKVFQVSRNKNTRPERKTTSYSVLYSGSVLTKIQHFLSYIAVPDVSRLKIQERPVLWYLDPGGKRENQGEFYFRIYFIHHKSIHMGILTLISSQRQPKWIPRAIRSLRSSKKAGRKIKIYFWPKKKSLPTPGDTWQKLRLPTSQVYTLENAYG